MNSQWSTKISIAKLSYANTHDVSSCRHGGYPAQACLPGAPPLTCLWCLEVDLISHLPEVYWYRLWLTRPTQVQTQSNARTWTTVVNALFAQKQEMQKISFFFHLYLLVFSFHTCEPVQRKCKYKDEIKKAGSIGSISPGLSETDLDFGSASYLPCKLAISSKWSIILDLPVKWWLVLILTGLDVAKNQRDTSSRSSSGKCFAGFSAFRLEKV